MSVGRALRLLTTAALMGATASGMAGAQSQNATITGQVVNEFGRPLEGANVFITELNISVGANEAGRYTILIPGARVTGQNVVVRVRSIGYAPQARQLPLTRGETSVNFTMKEDVNRLSTVVVTGVTAGTEQAKVPFAVGRVDASDMPVPAVNPLSQLQGKVPGANIVSASGRPGAQPAVILRGPTAINAQGRGQDPLYIVDGVILTGPLPDLNPLDIESVEVVKGAAAASLYGARAGNGVIQITTKSGKAGGPEGIRFGGRTEYGVSDIERDFGIAKNHALFLDETQTRFCQNVTGQPFCARTINYQAEQARINNAAGDFALTPSSFTFDPGSGLSGPNLRQYFQANRWPGKTYNAVDQVVNPQPFQQHNLEMTGRFGGTNFFASASYLDQGGAIRFLDGFERQSARLNLDQAIGTNWTAQLRTFYSHGVQDGLNQEGGGAAFFRLTRVPPIVNVLQRDTLGRLYVRPNLQAGGSQNENPLQSLENIDRTDVSDRFLGGASLRYTPFSWMDLDGNFSYDYLNVGTTQFQNKGFRTTTSSPAANAGSINRQNVRAQSFNTSLNASLKKDFGADLRTRTNLRYLYEQQDANWRNLNGTHLAVQGVTSSLNATQGQAINSSETSVRQVGMFAGVNTEYKERYIIDVLARRDGSSLFGAANRWANFGRASLAWRLSQEPWWFASKINEFKLRSSYGTAGGRPNFLAQYETFTIQAGGALSFGFLGNRELKPETITEKEFGLDLEAFNRIGFNATFAISDSRDQILPVPVASAAGFAQRWTNAGTLQNKTIELSLNVPLITKRDFSWSTRFIYDRNRAVITKLNTAPFTFGTSLQATEGMFLAREGERFGTFYGRKFVTECSELPGSFQQNCGSGRAFQKNDDGWIVWVGEGNSPQDGITRNLWQSTLPGCRVTVTGRPQPISQDICTSQPATGQTVDVMAPWGVGLSWGTPIIMRDESQVARIVELGNALPKYRFSVSQNLTWKRLTTYVLLDANMGQKVYNQGRHWSYLDFLSRDQDQGDKSVGAAKPVGYYYRAKQPDHPAGIGGLYDLLGPSNAFVEDASYAKLREATVSYRIGRIGMVGGDWQVSVVGRNLLTITDYKGFDPEVGIGTGANGAQGLGRPLGDATTGASGSAAINAVDAFSFPNIRTVTFGLSTSF